MASIAHDRKSNTRRILFVDGDGKRRTVRLGKVSGKDASTVCHHVEALLAAKLSGSSPPRASSVWLADIGEVLHDRLTRAGLCEARTVSETHTLGGLLNAYFDGLEDQKPATVTRMRQAEATLLGFFGHAEPVNAITSTGAECWRAQLVADGYAQATVSRTVGYARSFFRWAVRRGLAESNPFLDLRAGAQVNPERSAFVDRAIIAKVLDAAPDAEWRLLIALSRFGGLRVPSEPLALTWHDVDWENMRLTVRSSKTAHHAGKASRMVPIFPEIAEHLREVFEQAEAGAVHVITRYRNGQNLNPQLRRIIKRAGIEPWPRTWHNMRATRQSELASTYPLHTVCGWMGNTKAIAAGHYLQVTDADWQRAVGLGDQAAHNAAQHTAARAGSSTKPNRVEVSGEAFLRDSADGRRDSRNAGMGRPGLEPGTPAFSMPCSTN